MLFGGSGHCRVAPSHVWKEAYEIGIVRKVLPSNELIVETTGGLRTIKGAADGQYEKGHTLEFDAAEGVIRLLSETPTGRLRDEIDEFDETPPTALEARKPSKVGFSDFGGFEDVVAEARELIESQFQYRKFAERIGARPVRGVLFTGPPGVGKTHLARIIASETEADFHLVDGPSLISKWVGSSERALRDVFARAEASDSGRAIIFFDEIDTIAERRTERTHEMSRKLVGQFLTLMDGFRKDASIIVIAATNRPEALDPALLRPGRFDRQVAFRIPNLIDRLQILKVGASRLQTDIELPFEDIATLTEGWSAADLALIWTEAAQVASRDRRSRIAAEDMVLGFERASRRLAMASGDRSQ